MKSTDKPSLIETVIASGANASYVRTIPKTQTKSGSGEMSLALGWPPECAIPVAAGGKYPQMADANGVLNLLSAAVQQLQARFFGAYNADFATAIGGYPLNAIVSDTTAGKFWVSTAEDNTTAPGSDGASWQNLFNGYATEAWASSAFVRNNAGTSGGIVALDLDSDGSGRAAFERKDGSWGILQPAGDYATNTALQSEASSRASADTNLQNQVNNRVLKSGDTSTGDQVTSNRYSNGPGSWGPAWVSRIAGMSGGQSSGDYSFSLYAQAVDNQFTAGMLSFNGFRGRKDFRFNEDGNIFTPLGTVALVSELPTSGTITGGTYTKVPLNDGTVRSVLTQSFTVSGIYNGSTITIPISLSGNPVSIVVAPNTNYSTGSDPSTGNWSSSQFSFHNAGDTAPSYSFIVEGIL